MEEYLGVISRDGRVTIPAEIRRALGLRAGDVVAWVRQGEEIRPAPARFTLESAFGSVKPRRRPEDFGALTDAAKAARARETVGDPRDG